MLIQWCIQCKSVPFWMSEGFHSHVGANLAGSAGTCWRCQGLAGVIDALWWCPTITVEMTAAACVMPDRKEHLPTMARFHRRSCFPNTANCGQGKKKTESERWELQRTSCKTCQRGKHVNMQQCCAAMLCRSEWCKVICWGEGLGCGGAAACLCDSCYYISQWHQWTWTVGTMWENETLLYSLKCCTPNFKDKFKTWYSLFISQKWKKNIVSGQFHPL